MFIAPIAKKLEAPAITKTLSEKLHEYVRYDANNAVLPTIQKTISEKASDIAKTVSQALDIIV